MDEIRSRIKIALTVIIPLAIAILAFYTRNSKDFGSAVPYIIAIIEFLIALTVIAFIFFYSVFARFFEGLRFSLNRLYSDFIYSHIKVRIEYLKKDGSLVSYERDDHITKLSLRRSKRIFNLRVAFTGKIIRSKVSSINSTYAFVNDNTIVFQCYFHESNLIGKEHRAGHSFLIKDSFLNEEESWSVTTKRFCQKYFFNIVLPIEKKFSEVRIMYAKINDFDPDLGILDPPGIIWSQKNDQKYMLRYRKNHNMLSLMIVGLKPTDIYKIYWKIN